jgi:HEAT repeat protein
MHEKAVEVLAKIGKPAVDDLVHAMEDRSNKLLRLGAAAALGAMGAEGIRARAALAIVAQRDPDADVRKAAEKSWRQVQVKPIKKKPTDKKKPLGKN